MEPTSKIKEVLERGYLMSLATLDEGGLWVCDVHYVADDELDLYWISNPNSRHSQALLKNPRIAATITVSNGLPGDPNLGVQFSGTASKIDGDLPLVAAIYQRKKGKTYVAGDDILRDRSWYKITLSKVDLIDEATMGFKKVIVDLD